MARESAEKLPQYDRSRLFRYLYDRGFGTSGLQVQGLGPLDLDRWVADLIDYPNARNGYEFLKKTPELVAAEVSRRRDQFTELMKQVEAIEKAEADKVGLTAVLAEGDALGLERDRLVQRARTGSRSRPRASSKALAEVDQVPEPNSTARRSSGSGRSSARPSSPCSEKRARQTPEPEDDAIVAELASLDERIDEIGPLAWPRLANAGRTPTACKQGSTGSSASIARPITTPTGRTSKGSTSPGKSPASRRARSTPTTSGGRSSRPRSSGRTGSRMRPSRTARRSPPAPTGRVILGAIVDIAGAAMQDAAYRGVQRGVECLLLVRPLVILERLVTDDPDLPLAWAIKLGGGVHERGGVLMRRYGFTTAERSRP